MDQKRRHPLCVSLMPPTRTGGGSKEYRIKASLLQGANSNQQRAVCLLACHTSRCALLPCLFLTAACSCSPRDAQPSAIHHIILASLCHYIRSHPQRADGGGLDDNAAEHPGDHRAQPAKHSRSAWHNYVRQHRAEDSLAGLAAKWAALAAETKKAYEPQLQDSDPPAASAALPAALPQPVPRPWPYAGDDDYPLKADCVADLPWKIAEMSNAWRGTVGHGTIQPTASIIAPPERLCSDAVGFGHCLRGAGAAAGEHDALSACRRRLHQWSSMTKRPPARFDGLWHELPSSTACGRLHIGPAAGAPAQAAEDPRGYLLCLIYFEKRPPMEWFFVGRCIAPQAGSTVGFDDMSVNNIRDDIEVARR